MVLFLIKQPMNFKFQLPLCIEGNLKKIIFDSHNYVLLYYVLCLQTFGSWNYELSIVKWDKFSATKSKCQMIGAAFICDSACDTVRHQF